MFLNILEYNIVVHYVRISTSYVPHRLTQKKNTADAPFFPKGLGLANGPNGLVLRADRSKEPVEFTSLNGDFGPFWKKNKAWVATKM